MFKSPLYKESASVHPGFPLTGGISPDPRRIQQIDAAKLRLHLVLKKWGLLLGESALRCPG